MSNNFTDFFETLLPREVVLYVLPGSFTLGTILLSFKPDFKYLDQYIHLNKPHEYIFWGLIWIGTTYLVGLIVGAIKRGIGRYLRKILRYFGYLKGLISIGIANFRRNPTIILKKSRWDYFIYYILPITGKEQERNTKTSEYERLRNEFLTRSTTTKELGEKAMYLALCEEKMYRREIERYGVIVETIENIGIALVIVGGIVHFLSDGKRGIILLIISILVFPGAAGYRELQSHRIKTMFKALERKEYRYRKYRITDT